ncbi:MAG: DUF465 domain-containing protein [Nitrospinae bacterium]|nr:DUF465 domain-containing protein [Nitrospinota bacterium]
MLKEEDIIEKVKKENEEFRRLYEEHQRLEERLEEFNKKRFLVSDEEIERKRIQKIKLYGKDRMAEILSNYKTQLNE